MPGGWLVGLGQGIQQAGGAYANAKQEAIARMFRERQMAMQEQQLQEQIREAQFQDASRMMGQLPAATPVDLGMFGPGGEPAVRALSQVQQVPDKASPLRSARSLPMPIQAAPTLDATAPAAPPAGTIAAQNLAPTIEQRVSVPTEDAKYRAALIADATRNRIADQSNAARLQIAQAKLALQQQLATTTDAYRKQLIQQGWQRLDVMEKSLASLNQYRDASMNNMEYDNLLNQWKAQYGGGATADDPFGIKAILAQSMAGSLGVTPPAPGATPGAAAAPPKPPPPAPPPTRGGGGRVHTPPNATTPPSDDPYTQYLERRRQPPQ